ncbi:MAG: hypothetical protein VB034_07675 [Eubacteriales bacterium]|nr:hypothetical protein [Eubacteriales bacterium]
MDYAIIESGVVVNVIVGPLPDGMDGVALGDRPVAIGDSYTDGVFTRNGESVLTPAERIAALEAQIAKLTAQ